MFILTGASGAEPDTCPPTRECPAAPEPSLPAQDIAHWAACRGRTGQGVGEGRDGVAGDGKGGLPEDSAGEEGDGGVLGGVGGHEAPGVSSSLPVPLPEPQIPAQGAEALERLVQQEQAWVS